MDCRTVIDHLDLLNTSEQSDVVDEIVQHLSSCERCRKVSQRHQDFDARVKRSLHAVDVPIDLEASLLAAIEAEESSPQPVSTPSRRIHFPRWLIAGIAVCMLVAVTIVWWPPSPPSALNFAATQQMLGDEFRHNDDGWESLPEFDRNFADSFDRVLAKLHVSEPRGMDLNGDRVHDVAVHRFTMSRWKGILIVMPTDRFEGEPESTSPQVFSGQRRLVWRSVDGSVTYLCFVHSGAMEQFTDKLFGPIT